MFILILVSFFISLTLSLYIYGDCEYVLNLCHLSELTYIFQNGTAKKRLYVAQL